MALPHLSNVPSQLLPSLTHETELLKILADEKMRGEQHKTNYQLLKMEHTRLQDEHLRLQNDIKNLLDENKNAQEKIHATLEQYKKDIFSKQSEIEQLKSQILSPQRLEIIRLKVQEEMEQPFKEKILLQNQEIDKLRNEFNRLRYDNSFLKSEYEHTKIEQQRIIEEMTLKYKSEIATLTKECEILKNHLNSDPNHDIQKLRSLQRENGQLQLKIKGLLTELEEIRAQREHSGLQADNITRLQAKQLSEHVGNIKTIEAEKESLKFQLDSLQKELNLLAEQHLQLTNKIYELEKINSEVRNKLDEENYKYKMEMTNLKMIMVKEKGEIERERDVYLNELEDVRSQLEILKKLGEQQSHQLFEKEREVQRKIQLAKEEEWHKITNIETEKLELESKIQELERYKIDESNQRQVDVKKAEDNARLAIHNKELLEKECNVLRIKVHKHQSSIEELEKEKSLNSELHQQIQQLKGDLHSLSGVHQDLRLQNSKLKSSIDLLTNELKVAKADLVKMKDTDDKVLTQHKSNVEESKKQYLKRIEELEQHISHLHLNHDAETQSVKKKKQRYIKLIFKLKDKIQTLEIQISELKIEQEKLNNFINPEKFVTVKKQLQDLQRRHNEFKQVLFLNQALIIGDTAFLDGVKSQSSLHHIHLDQEHQHQQDLLFLKERLDQLATIQKKQMEDLTSIPLITQKYSAR